mgnify:CR=1 FL=1
MKREMKTWGDVQKALDRAIAKDAKNPSPRSNVNPYMTKANALSILIAAVADRKSDEPLGSGSRDYLMMRNISRELKREA